MKIHNADPRVKFLIVAFITSIGVISTNISLLLVNFLLGLIYAKVFDVSLLKVIKRIKKVLYFLMIIIVVQSIFTSEGTALIKVQELKIITDVGLKRGIGYLFRVMTILVSGSIIASSSIGDILKGFSKLGMPYEFAFTASLGVRFLPILVEEIQNTYTAIELRGVNTKKLRLGKRIEMISYLFLPIIFSTIVRSKKISESVDMRGFKVGGKRTWYRDINFSGKDYIIGFITILVFAGVIYFFRMNGE